MRISQEEWNKRLEEVKLASEDCKTIEEIVGITDYSRYIIKQLFEKFPEEAKEIQANLAKNNGKTKKKKRRKPNNKRRLTKILEASETCKSFAELSKATGFSDFIIKNTLSKFPDEEAMVRENLDKNRPSQATTAKVEKNISASKNDNNFSIAMLDTSVYGLDNIFEILEEYAREGKILGITDVVLEELANLQKTMDTKGKCACNFLYIIMDNLSAFQLFEVKHNMLERETIDEAIIRATLDLGKKALLLTSDKEMYIKAALKGVKAKYLLSSKKRENKFEFNLEETREKSKEHRKIKAKTFIDAHEENGKLFFIRKKRKTQLVKIFSKSGEEKYGDKIELEIGDHVFICTKREDYIRFLDYEVYFLKEDGFLERYSTKSYNCDVTVNVENHDYKKVIEQARKTLIK